MLSIVGASRRRLGLDLVVSDPDPDIRAPFAASQLQTFVHPRADCGCPESSVVDVVKWWLADRPLLGRRPVLADIAWRSRFSERGR